MLRRTFLSLTFFSAALYAAELGPLVMGVDSIGMTVSDLDRSVEFYSKVLSFEKVSESEAEGSEQKHLQGVFGLHTRTARMRLGGEFIELTEYLAPKGRPAPADTHANDRWFQHIAIITSDMEKAYGWLRRNKVQHASSSPQRLPDWNRNAAGIQAFYFRDPDGHFLEVLAFPADKGSPQWHSKEGLFLGIDHTAIVVADTEQSLRFYRDTLGMQIAGESENYGGEQEHLNNVFGARLRITSLRAPAGPGVEFLEYLAPRDGRPYPRDEKANDLVHWQTVFTSREANGERILRGSGADFVSTGEAEVAGSTGEVQRSLVVRDPDGHAVELRAQ